MAHISVAATFQDIGKARQIAPDVGLRVGDAVAHPGLSRQVDHIFRLMLREQPPQAIGIRQIAPNEGKIRRAFFLAQFGQPGFFQPHVIVAVEIVQADHAAALAHKPPGQMKTNESGRAGYQNIHQHFLKRCSLYHPRPHTSKSAARGQRLPCACLDTLPQHR